jgi:N-acetyl-anhydromuramyl-L-alanine amidase AmpD
VTFETERWPTVQARDYLAPPSPRKVRLIVMHTAEIGEKPDSAESVAQYFQHPDKPSSCHIVVDNNSIIQCVRDSHVAYAAPGANSDGIQIELCGYARQTPKDWLDLYSLAELALAADAVAQYSLKFDIPILRLSDDALKKGARGIVGHDQVSAVYKQSTHTDPGPSFPWRRFLLWAKACSEERSQ